MFVGSINKINYILPVIRRNNSTIKYDKNKSDNTVSK